jgi:site-specific DNA recombinase
VTASPVSDSKVKSGAGSPSRSTAASIRRAIGITRVSRKGEREGERFVSISEQEERIGATCAREGLKLLETQREEDVSGGASLEARPGLSRAVALVESGEAHVIVVAYFDRLVRSLAVQRELLERVEAAGGAILAVDVGEVRADTASRWLSSTMLGMVAEYHRRVTAERTVEAKRRAIARGVAPFPKLPFYLRRDEEGRVEHDPRKVRLMREAIRMRLEGTTISSVRDFLSKRRVRLSYHGVQSLFSSRLLLGELRFGDMANESAFPPVTDIETWQRLQRVAVPRGRRPKSDRLLARLGILRCGTCGSKMVVGSSQGHYALYRCPPVGDCPQRVTISAEAAERTVVDAVQALLAGVEGRATVESGVDQAADELAARQEALDKAIRNLAGFEDEQAAREQLQELRDARDRARDHHDVLLAASEPAVTISAGDWELLTLEDRRALIRAVLERVVVAPGRGGDRVTIAPRGEPRGE